MLMISLAASAILLLKESALIIFCGLLFWAVAYLIMMRWIDKRWIQNNK
jgi:hypothetical protein